MEVEEAVESDPLCVGKRSVLIIDNCFERLYNDLRSSVAEY